MEKEKTKIDTNRSTVREKCLAQEHSVATPVKGSNPDRPLGHWAFHGYNVLTFQLKLFYDSKTVSN